MADAVQEFLESGGALPKQVAKASQSNSEIDSSDPVQAFLASGGKNLHAITAAMPPQVDDRGYIQKVGDAAKAWWNAPDHGFKSGTEAVLSMATAAPVNLVKHAVAEGAYLSGQEPEQARRTAERVIPISGYEPRTEAGRNLAGVVGAIAEPLVDAGRWAAEKAGLSETAQDLAGDFSAVLIPKGAKAAVKEVPETFRGARNALSDLNAQYRELVRAGKEMQLPQKPPTITPQMIRGQEPIPAEIQPAAAKATQAAPPAITIENASPAIRQAIAESGPRPNAVAIQRHLEADSLPVPVRLTAGQASGNIKQLSDEFNNRGRQPALADRFNAQNSELIQNVNAIRERAAPQVMDTNYVDNGAALIDSYKALNKAREAEVSANYKALADANNGEIPVDGKAFAKGVEDALGRGLVNKREFLPASVERIVQRIGESEQQMTFDDFTTLRTILAKEARKATAAGDGNASHAINLVRDQLENIPMGPGAEALKPLADKAKNSARALFQDIEADPAWNAAINGKVPADKFVQKFVISAPRDSVARMKTNLGGDDLASQTIAASTLNFLKDRAGLVGDSGNFSQAGYNKALKGIEPKLDALLDPLSVQQVKTLGNVARYTQEQPRGSYFNNSNTFVAAARDAAKSAAENAVNAKTMGAYGTIKGALSGRREAKKAAESVKPGAGIALKDIGKD